ncbi:MAG: transglutaminase domain-containing protein [Deltaproteobacteria bacterium]|nr:MAG: transglutaminase domain-containing protein [Deltaproteobacteria bacterium]
MQIRSLSTIALTAAALAATAASPPAAATSADSRSFTFQYSAEIGPLPDGAGPVDIYVPIARDTALQRVERLATTTSIPGEEAEDPVYGNRFWHGHLDAGHGETVSLTFTYRVTRHAFPPPDTASRSADPPRPVDLAPNARVPISGEPVDGIVAEIAPGQDDPLAVSRAIYDYVIDHMEYKKVGTGWGNGDTFWACSAGYGNCTDFHSLYLSLARARGIPARFVMGFPIPDADHEVEVQGYHCWVEFYVDGRGWLPLDASEADKHPDRRDALFGAQPPDRVEFTVGRDLVLDAHQQGPPLNYFIYPYVEVGGEPDDQVRTRFLVQP